MVQGKVKFSPIILRSAPFYQVCAFAAWLSPFPTLPALAESVWVADRHPERHSPLPAQPWQDSARRLHGRRPCLCIWPYRKHRCTCIYCLFLWPRVVETHSANAGGRVHSGEPGATRQQDLQPHWRIPGGKSDCLPCLRDLHSFRFKCSAQAAAITMKAGVACKYETVPDDIAVLAFEVAFEAELAIKYINQHNSNSVCNRGSPRATWRRSAGCARAGLTR